MLKIEQPFRTRLRKTIVKDRHVVRILKDFIDNQYQRVFMYSVILKLGKCVRVPVKSPSCSSAQQPSHGNLERFRLSLCNKAAWSGCVRFSMGWIFNFRSQGLLRYRMSYTKQVLVILADQRTGRNASEICTYQSGWAGCIRGMVPGTLQHRLNFVPGKITSV